MKIKHKVIKVSDSSEARKADQLGLEYEQYHNQREAAANALSGTAETIKAFAANYGVEEGKSKLVEGRHFFVGFVQKEMSPKIDEKKAKLLLNPAQIRKVSEEVISESKLIAAVKKGIVSRETFKRLLYTPPSHRVVSVKRKNKQ